MLGLGFAAACGCGGRRRGFSRLWAAIVSQPEIAPEKRLESFALCKTRRSLYAARAARQEILEKGLLEFLRRIDAPMMHHVGGEGPELPESESGYAVGQCTGSSPLAIRPAPHEIKALHKESVEFLAAGQLPGERFPVALSLPKGRMA